jgi:lantibiotic modifying enzyme
MDGLDRDLVLGKLLTGYAASASRSQMVSGEASDLWRGDVPLFEVGVRDGIVFHNGEPLRPRAVVESPLQDVRERAERLLAPEAQRRERQVVELAFGTAMAKMRTGTPGAAAAATDYVGRGVNTWEGSENLDTPCSRQEPDAAAKIRRVAAEQICDEIIRRAIKAGGHIGWLSAAAAGPFDWAIAPAALDFYSGLSGIGHALSLVGRRTGGAILEHAEWVLREVAEYAEVAFQDGIEEALDAKVFDSGAFGHAGGLLLAMADAYVKFGDGLYLDAARTGLRWLSLLARQDQDRDVVSGNAGCVLAVLAASEMSCDIDGGDLVEYCVGSILDAAITNVDDGSLSWRQRDGGKPLLGFAHGSAGVACALSAAGDYMGRDDWRDAAERALRFESRFVTSDGDWPDFRDDPSAASADIAGDLGQMRAWCHGAPGAGLARSLILGRGGMLQDRGRITAELGKAALSTANSLFARSGGPTAASTNLCLCHGAIGNLICLEKMLAQLPPSTLSLEAGAIERAWLRVCEIGMNEGWSCGSPMGVPVPGLMMGLAGIAWGLEFQQNDGKELDVLTLAYGARREP